MAKAGRGDTTQQEIRPIPVCGEPHPICAGKWGIYSQPRKKGEKTERPERLGHRCRGRKLQGQRSDPQGGAHLELGRRAEMELRTEVGKALCSLETEENKVCWRECRILLEQKFCIRESQEKRLRS